MIGGFSLLSMKYGKFPGISQPEILPQRVSSPVLRGQTRLFNSLLMNAPAHQKRRQFLDNLRFCPSSVVPPSSGRYQKLTRDAVAEKSF